MKILILTYGSTGDVLPYVALGKGLVARGHTVVICSNSRFEELIKQHGLGYAYMSDEITQLIESAIGRNILEGLTNLVGFCKTIFKLIRKLGPLQTEILENSWAAAKQVKPDIIIFSPKNYAAIHFAEKLKTAAICAPLFPQYVSTATHPTLGFPEFNNTPRYNQLTYSLVRSLSSIIGSKYIKRWRKSNQLPEAFCGIDICRDSSGNTISVINGYSPSVIPPPSDWPKTVHTCGFWFLNQAENWSPPNALLKFLAEGPPPVYVGFGSMASSRSKVISDIVVNALLSSGVRGIIATGWGGLETSQLPDTIFKVTDVPHDWLFPQVSAVIHHGGAGTTAAGLKAGCPTLICPIFGDQPLWGKYVHDLGVGPPPISQKKLTVDMLAKSINALLTTLSIKQKAIELSMQIKNEKGIEAAIAAIESDMKRYRNL